MNLVEGATHLPNKAVNLNVTDWKLLCLGQVLRHSPRKGPSHMTRDVLLVKPFTQLCMKDLRVSVSDDSTLLAQSCGSLGGYCPHLVNLGRISAFSRVNVGNCAQPRIARIPKQVSFGGRVLPWQYNQQFVMCCA